MSFLQKYPIIPRYLSKPSKRRSGISADKIRFLVAHDTGNPKSTALNNINWYESTKNQDEASAHIFVDDKQILECVPALTAKPEKAWHVRKQMTKDNELFGANANDAAIGIEYCYGSNINADESYRRYVWVLAYCCDYFNLDPLRCIVGHYLLDPGRKTDPVSGLAKSFRTMDQLIADVAAEYRECKGLPANDYDFIAEDRVMTAGLRLNVRKKAPSVKSEIFTVLDPGDSFISEGYVTDGQSISGNTKWFRDAQGNYVWSGGLN